MGGTIIDNSSRYGGTGLSSTPSYSFVGNSFLINRISNTTPCFGCIGQSPLPPTTVTDFVVTSNGTVGIGTATPVSVLDVSGGISVGSYAGVNSAPTNSMIISGQVGIGTTSPLSSLDVSGGLAVGTYGGTNAAPANGAIISGQVGIGTSSPQAALDVQGGVVRIGAVSVVNPQVYAASNTGNPGFNGYSLYVQYGVLAESFKCAASGDPSNWSDYVFDKDYKLKSLSELEGYIKDHHHLPDVPSADDVACDGIDMANMDATLLKKIEELTLYVLDLKKDNEAIKAEIKILKK